MNPNYKRLSKAQIAVLLQVAQNAEPNVHAVIVLRLCQGIKGMVETPAFGSDLYRKQDQLTLFFYENRKKGDEKSVVDTLFQMMK